MSTDATGTDPGNLATSGIDIAELDEQVRPQDDLYRHVNGKWEQRTAIPEDKARYGSFHILAEEAEKAVRDIITDGQSAAEGTEQRKVGDLYASFMDTERIEAVGVSPLESQIALASNSTTISELLDTVARLERHGVSGFFDLFVDNDPGDPTRYLVFVEQGGIGLPDESYYREEKFESVREAYVSHIQRMFELTAERLPGAVGVDDAARRAQRVFELEKAIAATHWDNVRSREAQETYNPMSWAQMHELVAEATRESEHTTDLDIWLTALAAPAQALTTVVVRQPSFLTGLGELFAEHHMEAWQDWTVWQVIHSAAPFLPEEFVSENFDFYGRTLTGTPEQRARWKRGVAFVEGSMGEAVGRVYVERHFPEVAKAHMDVLVANLIRAYRESIQDLEWMSADTRARALEKLEKFTPKIGYPSKWKDYSSLEIDPTDLLGNVRRIATYEFDREMGKIGKPIDREEWFMTPQTVNAYYNPGFNEIVFPAAILQPPFFDPSWDDAANYGSIGAVIGHEIGHGFDDQGSRFDGDGKLIDWWTEDDRQAFEKRTAVLIDQYNALAPKQVPNHFVNGELTIGENIGDLGGLAIAWKAYLLSLDGAEPPVIDGLTGAQRFFLSWAQSWQQKGRDEEVIRLLAIDPHSPNEFRCNQIVRNIDAFYAAFDVQKNDELWLDEADRVSIW